MMTRTAPEVGLVEQWLRDAGQDYYICDQCHGLHLSDLQVREAVLDARLFVEADSLLLSVELEIRPSVLLYVQADLARLNMNYPGLKLFLDVSDDSLPRLVLCDTLYTEAGLNAAQFELFLARTREAIEAALAECQGAGWTGWPELSDDGEPPPSAVH